MDSQAQGQKYAQPAADLLTPVVYSLFFCTWQLGYGPTVAGSIRVNYEKYLYPYEIFLAKSGQLEVCV